MNIRWLLFGAMLLFVFSSMLPTGAVAQNNVTFQVNMRILMEEGKFKPGSGDIVRVAGSFSDWGNSVDTLKDENGDSIYTAIVSDTVGAIQYKFLKTLRGGIDWEHNQPTSSTNREYTVTAGDQTLPVVYFNDDSVYTAPPHVPVTFQVNMSVKMKEGTFLPDSGDIVSVPGDLNGWSTSAEPLSDGNHDSIYTRTDSLEEGSTINYKFYKSARGGIDWESGGNKQYTVPVGGGTISAVWFDGDSVVNTPVSASILWQIDMSAMEDIGWFSPILNDSLEVRGSFTGWGGTRMDQNAITQTEYEVNLPYSGFLSDQLFYKYHINLDSVSGEARFPGFGGNKDGVQYDHPYTSGDGNRAYVVNSGGNISPESFYFDNIHRYGTLLNTTDTVWVTLSVNMGPATRYVDPFVLGTDTVKLMWQDYMWAYAQVGNQGSFPQTVLMTRKGPSDSVWSVTFKVKGKAHYGLMYNYRFIHAAGGTSVDEGGGLGVQNPYRTRYIQPLGHNSFPTSYSAPVDQWQKSPPLPAEEPPFGITGVIGKAPGKPLAYKLNQNYPNPFNPASRITYSIPEKAMVTLKVFNILGQEVATLVHEQQSQGNYVALFDGSRLSSGVYFYRLQAGTFLSVKKMILLK